MARLCLGEGERGTMILQMGYFFQRCGVVWCGVWCPQCDHRDGLGLLVMVMVMGQCHGAQSITLELNIIDKVENIHLPQLLLQFFSNTTVLSMISDTYVNEVTK